MILIFPIDRAKYFMEEQRMNGNTAYCSTFNLDSSETVAYNTVLKGKNNSHKYYR